MTDGDRPVGGGRFSAVRLDTAERLELYLSNPTVRRPTDKNLQEGAEYASRSQGIFHQYK
jgi:hypothetical protein